MPAWSLVLTRLAVLALGAVLFRLRREQRRQREAVHQVRESKLYAHVYPLLVRCQHQHIEQVSLTREALYIRLFSPAGRVLTYHFEQHGFHPIPPERIYPMAQAIGVDLKELSDPRKYDFTPRERIHANGEREAYYEYNIVTSYKDDVQRMLYTGHGRAGA